MANELQHFGIPGMKWGHRKPQDSGGSSGGRKTVWGPTNQDGRKVNKLFGARNRKAIRNFFLGDPDVAVKNLPILKTKYAAMTPEQKKRAKAITSKVLATISVVGTAAIAAEIYSLTHSDE